MRSIVKWMLVPAVVALAACGHGDDQKLDDGLQNDLGLASQVQPYQPQQFVSPQEMQYGQYPQPMSPQQYQAAARGGYYSPAPVYSAPRSAPRTIHRASTSRARTSSGRSYPAPAREPVRHTKRDAAIGGVAGAAIGAVTSRDKVKGAIIGGAAGAVLGGIIGHTVDVQH